MGGRRDWRVRKVVEALLEKRFLTAAARRFGMTKTFITIEIFIANAKGM